MDLFAVGKTVNKVGGGGNLSGNITTILNAIIGFLGIVAVIFVVVGGVQYLTSAGDPSKVEKGKKTILYAVIGLIICALAFVIVNFVIATLLGQGGTTTTTNTTNN